MGGSLRFRIVMVFAWLKRRTANYDASCGSLQHKEDAGHDEARLGRSKKVEPMKEVGFIHPARVNSAGRWRIISRWRHGALLLRMVWVAARRLKFT